MENFLWIVDQNKNLTFLAKGGKRQNLLSPDQRWLLQIDTIMDRTTGTARQLSSPQGCEIRSDMVSWSNDSAQLFYIVTCGSDLGTDIWSIDTSTWESKNITNTPNRQEWCFSYTPECKFSYPYLPGKLLFKSSKLPIPTAILGAPRRWESDAYLTQVDEDGKNYRVLDEEHGIFGNISIAPDGDAIAYDGGFILFKDGRKRQLNIRDMQIPYDKSLDLLPASIRNDSIDIVNPAWSPDGNKIAWDLAHLGSDNQTGVAIYNVKIEKAQLLLTFEPYYWTITICTCEMWQIRDLVWSPDGQWLAFSNIEFPDKEISNRNEMFAEEHSSIWVFNQDGQNVFSMYGVEFHTKPVWSADGQWLGFTARDRDMHSYPVIVKVGEWKPYQTDLPFQDVSLIGW